jgi:hypothetical protein
MKMQNFDDGTSARALDMTESEKIRVDYPGQGPTKARSVKTGAKTRIVYVNDGIHKLPVLAVVTLMVVLAAAFVIASGIAEVAVLKKEQSVLTEELRQENLLINAMTEKINRTQDVAKMREIAEELGMGEPQPYQILHITVPENDYAEIND